MEKENKKDYETLLSELQEIMKKMEDTNISLESQISAYEKGMDLVAKLNAILKDSEERIMLINSKGEEEKFE